MEEDLRRSSSRRRLSETSNSSLSDGLDEWGCPYGILKARPSSKAQRKEDRRQRRERNKSHLPMRAIDPTDDELNVFDDESSDDDDEVFEAFGKGEEEAEKYHDKVKLDDEKPDNLPSRESTTLAEVSKKPTYKLSEMPIIEKLEKPTVEEIFWESTDGKRGSLDQKKVTMESQSETDENVCQRNVQFNPFEGESDEFKRTKRVITRNNGFVSLQPTSTYHIDSSAVPYQENMGWCYQQRSDWGYNQAYEYHQSRPSRPYYSSYKPAGPTNFKMNSNPMDCLDDDSDSPPNTPVLRKITMKNPSAWRKSLTVSVVQKDKNDNSIKTNEEEINEKDVTKTKPDICAVEPSLKKEVSGSSENKAIDLDSSSCKNFSNTSPGIVSVESHETPEVSKEESAEVSKVLQASVSSDESSSDESEMNRQFQAILMIAQQKQKKFKQQKAISDDFDCAASSDHDSAFSVESYEDPNDGEWVEPPSYESNQRRPKIEDIQQPISGGQFSLDQEKMIVSTLFALQRSATASQIVNMMKKLSGVDLGTTKEVDQKLSESRTIVKSNGTNAKGETIWTSVTKKDTAHIDRLLDQENSRKKKKFSKNKKVWGECFNDFSLQTLHETETNPERRKFTTSLKNSESTRDTRNAGQSNFPLWLGPYVCDRMEASASPPAEKVEKPDAFDDLWKKPKLSKKQNAAHKKAQKKAYEVNFDAQLRDAKEALRRRMTSEKSSQSDQEHGTKTFGKKEKRMAEMTNYISTVNGSRSSEMKSCSVVSPKTTRKFPVRSSDEEDCGRPERFPKNEKSERYYRSTWNLAKHEAGSRTKLFDIKRHLMSNTLDDASRKPQPTNTQKKNQQLSMSRFSAENDIPEKKPKPSRGIRHLNSLQNMALDFDEDWDLVTTGQSSGPLLSEDKTKKPWDIGDDLKNLYRDVISGKNIPRPSSDVSKDSNKENLSQSHLNTIASSAKRIDEAYAKALQGDDQTSRLVTTLLTETNGRENLKRLCSRFNKRMRLMKEPTFVPFTLSNFWKYLYSLPHVTNEDCDIVLVDPTKNRKHESQEKRVCKAGCAEKIEGLRKEFSVLSTEFQLVTEACGAELETMSIPNDLTSNGLPI